MPPARAGADVTTFSNDPVNDPPPGPPPLVPVVKVDVYGTNAAPLKSRRPLVTSNRYCVLATRFAVGWSTMTSPPPLLLTVADTWLLSLTLNRRTVDDVSVLRSMPPQFGRMTSAVTGASSATFVAAFA